MAKVQIKSEKLTPFGGIFMVMEQFDYMLSSVIDSTLGQRCSSIIGYRCILTNDYESSARAVVEFYNLRGGKERIFDDMNNGFGWNRLPKSFMESRFTKCAEVSEGADSSQTIPYSTFASVPEVSSRHAQRNLKISFYSVIYSNQSKSA